MTEYVKSWFLRADDDLRAVKVLLIDPSFGQLETDARYLNQFYIETRYPGDYPEFTATEAKEALEATQRIKDFVLQVIEKRNS